MLHDTLWRSNFDLAKRCLTHPFVQALADGSLNADLFRSFIAQDAFSMRSSAASSSKSAAAIIRIDCGFKPTVGRSSVEALLDRVGSDTTWVRDTYRYALRCELEFFSDALLFPNAAAIVREG